MTSLKWSTYAFAITLLLGLPGQAVAQANDDCFS